MPNKLKLIHSAQSNSQVIKYNQLIENAERAYFFGEQEKASDGYLAAFKLSIQLLKSEYANRVSVRRVVEVCNYCFDYCPILEDTHECYFLEIAGNALETIVKNSADPILRKSALNGYKSITYLACELVRYNQSTRCQSVIDRYIYLEAISHP